MTDHKRHESFVTASSARDAAMQEFWHYPRQKECTFKQNPRKEPANPALRGTLVKLGAKFLPLVPGLPGMFFKNAGWPSLREIDGMDSTDARYEPAVIPYRPKTYSDNASSYTDPAEVEKLPVPSKKIFHSILDYHEAYKSGKTTPSEVIEALLPIIQRDIQKPTEYSKAWLDLNLVLIKGNAAASTERWKQGKQFGVLDGVPLGVKDEVDLKGYYKKCFGSKVIFEDTPDETSWSVLKWEEQGAIILGKLSMHEIGMDTSNANPHYGNPLNGYNNKYYTGGSSGGSASAVSTGLVPLALGCDGGGSIRIPSSWCGIYGLKTSHGWVSTRPYQSRAASTAVAGPMAANMSDLEIGWRTMAQPDPGCPISRQFPMPSRPAAGTTYPKRLGIDKKWFDRADANVKSVCQKAVDYYRDTLGYEIIDISVPHLREAQMAHALTILNEVTSAVKKSDLKKLLPPNQILLTVGAKASCADFLAAQRIRTMVMEHLAFLFKKYPGLIIVTPTTPNAGWPIHKKDAKYGSSDGNRSIRNMEYVWLANFSGIPSISLPVGFVDPVQGEGKFPIGLMGAGEWGSEDQLLHFGYEGEKYLNEVYEGGRLKPKHWLDVFELVEKAAAKKDEKLEKAAQDDTKQVINDEAIKEKKAPKETNVAAAIANQDVAQEKHVADADTRPQETDHSDNEVKNGEKNEQAKDVETVDSKVAAEINGAR